MKRTFHRKLFYLTCALIPIQLGFHFWPSWAMVLGRRVDYLSPIFYLTDVFVAATLISWVIETWEKRKRVTFAPLFVVFLFVILTNMLVSKNIAVSLYQWMKVVEFTLFGLYIVKTKPKFEGVAAAFSIALTYSSVIAVVQFLLQRSIGGPLWVLGERTFFADTPGIAQINLCTISGNVCRLLLRPYGTFPHPNVLAGFIAVTLPYLLFSIINSKKEISAHMRKLFIFSFICGICALVITFGRSAWVAGTIGILLILHNAFQTAGSIFYKRHMKAIIFVGVLVVAAGFYFFSGNLVVSESVVVRNELNLAAIKMIHDNILFGVGWGNFLTALPSYLTTRTIYFLQPVHNIYLLALSQLGFIGMSFIIFCMVSLYKRFRNFSAVSAISLILILLLGVLDHYFLTLQQGQLLVSVVIGIFLASGNPRKSPTP
jgi:hypothetical protein